MLTLSSLYLMSEHLLLSSRKVLKVFTRVVTPCFTFSLKESKVLRTVPLLAACLPPDKCTVKIGRRFSEERDIELSTVCRDSGTLILYPGAEATNLEEFLLDSPVYPSTIILIDGTWSQAKDIFYKNSLFRLPKQVN
ncbi:hypothetical protein A6R68_23674 [Neotoma lepida]|uniref:tRNA-uridine aminocarboxypropyltransferase n=1 Tax=Neotoma lepida TaxID=56216 RepID=A0A1A6HX92_NEOLE|nr:hypothetical protein A6R68_23674 [Neotoma lepida]